MLRDDLPGAMCFTAGEGRPSAVLAALSRASQTRGLQAQPGWTLSAQMFIPLWTWGKLVSTACLHTLLFCYGPGKVF